MGVRSSNREGGVFDTGFEEVEEVCIIRHSLARLSIKSFVSSRFFSIDIFFQASFLTFAWILLFL